MAVKKRRMKADDLYRMQLIFDPQISPDGRHIIFCVQRADREKEKQYRNLWVIPSRGGRPRQFTYGDQIDSQPRWSPDGRQIAFLSDRNNDAQIYIIPFGGGEARPLTDMKGTFGEFSWSPDGEQLVCNFRLTDRELLELEADPERKELGIVSRRFTRADYKLDGAGFLPHEKWHIWTINARNGKGRQVTNGDETHELSPCWSPNGEEIAFLSNRSLQPDVDLHLMDLYVMPATGGEFRKIAVPPGRKSLPSYSPDGQWITYLGAEGKGNGWKNMSVWLVPADGAAPAVNLTGQYDVHVDSGTMTDTGERQVLPVTWSAHGGRLYFHVTRHGNVDLCSVTAQGEDFQTVISDGVVGAFSFDADQKKLAYFHGQIDTLGQIWLRDMDSGRDRQLTRFNERWLRGVDLGQIEEVWYQGPAGNRLQGWILKPPGFDETKKYPSILEIHGGPWGQYGSSFMHEFYFLAAHDYVVYFTNPRGGQGYGERHSQAIHRNWGEADYADLMGWVDLLAEKPYIDRDRMGVTGGSYGGYMTTWIIGHTHRFRAAVAQRIVSNLISFWGSSDMGYDFEDAWSSHGKPPWDDLEKYWEQSPIKFIDRVETPTMIIHSEQDWRCRQEQGEQVFLALRKRGVATELILFPDSSHGLSRTGRLDRRISRLNHILGWFEQYLK